MAKANTKEAIEKGTEKVANSAEESTELENSESVKVVEKVIERVVEKAPDEVRLDKKVSMRSIAPWITGSARITTNGDISVPPRGTVLLTREEIIAQSQNGNTLLNGVDGVGSHATWYVDDEYVRRELSFEDDGRTQDIASVDLVKKLFEGKSQSSFEKAVETNIKTRAEKAFLLDCIKKLKLNDYGKIAFCERYTGMRVEE